MARRDHDYADYQEWRRSHGGRSRSSRTSKGMSAGMFIAIIFAIWLWSKGHPAPDGIQHNTPHPQPVITVCNEYFKGGC